MMIYILLIVAVGIVVGLSGYALWLHAELRRRKQALADVGKKGHQEAIDGIRALANGMLNDEVNHTEGAIRIKVLSDYLFPCGDLPEEFRVFATIHDLTLHHPRGDKRKQVPRQTLKKLDDEREALERKYRDELLAAAKSAKGWDFTAA